MDVWPLRGASAGGDEPFVWAVARERVRMGELPAGQWGIFPIDIFPHMKYYELVHFFTNA
jgi:hypothetical protein